MSDNRMQCLQAVILRALAVYCWVAKPICMEVRLRSLSMLSWQDLGVSSPPSWLGAGRSPVNIRNGMLTCCARCDAERATVQGEEAAPHHAAGG